jgi:hypothetical protein
MIWIVAIIAIGVFALLRNKQAARNDARRERLWQKEEELKELLSKKDTNNELKNKEDER